MLERGLADSRSQAQALIMAGRLFSGEQRIDKAGTPLRRDTPLRLSAGPRFVSRGGDKLDHALTRFSGCGVRVADAACIDVGASTGGFTDCLLERGARRVYAVDVGKGQLHPRLRSDPRVVVREGVNARAMQPGDFPERIDLVVVDASFIGIGKLVGALAAVLPSGGMLVALVKPQFEVGRKQASRGRGVVRDESVRREAIARACASLERGGFDIVDQVDSPIRGPKGNLERFVCARRKAEPPVVS